MGLPCNLVANRFSDTCNELLMKCQGTSWIVHIANYIAIYVAVG